MAIYRGPGGAGDATNDATSQAILASASAVAAATSEAEAAASAASAATSAANAANSASDAADSAAEALATLTNKADIDGNNATGTWPISIDGNAATADSATTATTAGNATTVTNGVYTTGSYSNPTWITSLAETKVLPSQTTNSGKYLSTNGTSTSWTTVDALPTQSGNNGKYLTTDGSAASWATLNVDPNSTTKGLYEHSNTIAANYSITSGNNAMSAGTMTINSGVTVTVPSGSTWVLV